MERSHVYKICSEFDWDCACRQGELPAVDADLADGFVHLSAADQVQSTLQVHFVRRPGLLLLTVDVSAFEPGRLRWEASRAGARFPHLYGKLLPRHVRRVQSLPLDENGVHGLPSWLTAVA